MGNRIRRRAALLAAVCCLAAGLPRAVAASAGAVDVRMRVRFVDGASGGEAAWDKAGQLLLPEAPPPGARAGRVSPAAQEVFIPCGGRGEIRIGRAVPFAGWLQRYALREGLAEADAGWEDVEALLDIEVLAANRAGAVALALTPGLAYTQGRTRRRAVFATERVRLALPPGGEARLEAREGLGELFRRLLSGYDSRRRVRPVALLLSADPAGGGQER